MSLFEPPRVTQSPKQNSVVALQLGGFKGCIRKKRESFIPEIQDLVCTLESWRSFA